jgi:putative transposase
LPHWSQPGVVTFITWRTIDSMPRFRLDEWYSERAAWLRHHSIDPSHPHWRAQLHRLEPSLSKAFLKQSWSRWHDILDAGHGECPLRNPEIAEIVANSLRHFDRSRYILFDFVIMPNHVHLLVSFADSDSLLKQCESWKHFTATKTNQRLKQTGRFWQVDAFDHLVRSAEQFDYYRDYIAKNSVRAGLQPGEYVHYTLQSELTSRRTHAEREHYSP